MILPTAINKYVNPTKKNHIQNRVGMKTYMNRTVIYHNFNNSLIQGQGNNHAL